jgi:hypothetical protein
MKPSAALPLNRAEADVATAEAVGPYDAIDRLVGARLRLRNRLARGADIQHAPAIGEDATALLLRSGLENLHALDLGRGVEPFNGRPLCIVAGDTCIARRFRQQHGVRCPQARHNYCRTRRNPSRIPTAMCACAAQRLDLTNAYFRPLPITIRIAALKLT